VGGCGKFPQNVGASEGEYSTNTLTVTTMVEKTQELINKLTSFAPPPTIDRPPEGETFRQKFVRKVSKEPLVPVGAMLTVGFLTFGLRAFNHGNALQAQKLMRGRVMAQFFTVSMMLVGAYAGYKPGGEKPKNYEEKLAIEQASQASMDANKRD
jgi:hypothetical protein